jgi:hypothetical protein
LQRYFEIALAHQEEELQHPLEARQGELEFQLLNQALVLVQDQRAVRQHEGYEYGHE